MEMVSRMIGGIAIMIDKVEIGEIDNKIIIIKMMGTEEMTIEIIEIIRDMDKTITGKGTISMLKSKEATGPIEIITIAMPTTEMKENLEIKEITKMKMDNKDNLVGEEISMTETIIGTLTIIGKEILMEEAEEEAEAIEEEGEAEEVIRGTMTTKTEITINRQIKTTMKE